MLTAGLETMFLSVSVTKDMSETPLPTATDQSLHHQLQRLLIPADQVRVESMRNVEREMEQPLVPVSLVYLEIHMLNASQNVPLILNVQWIKPVLDRNVWILVLEFVEPTPPAVSEITIQHVGVTQDTLETPSLPATESQHPDLSLKLLTPAILPPVDPMLSVPREALQAPVNASLTTSETPMLPADLSVSSTLTVQQASNAETFTVLTPAQVSVAPMPTAGWPITSQSVSVTRDILGTHSCPVEDHQNLVVVFYLNFFFLETETF